MYANGVMTSYWFYKMAAISSKIYFRLLIWPRLAFRKVHSCRHTKLRPDIHGRYITTSGFCKQTAAMLKFCFWFRVSPFHCHRHVVFHRHTKFHCGTVMPPKIEHSYNLRRRRHDYKLIKKTSTLNINHFLIRMLYKDSYWHYLIPVFSNSKQSPPPLMRTCHYWINEYCTVLYCIV